MIAGSTANGTVDMEYSPQIARVAPPLGDVVHAMEATIKRLEGSIANQGEMIAAMHLHLSSLVARIYAVEMSVRELEAGKK